MEIISLKMEKELLNEIDKKLTKYRYATRTEFLRDAIRDKLNELEKAEMLKHVDRIHGISKKKSSDKKLHPIREQVFNELEKEFK
jgi:metal-responsive CopG/Arc/MetJ family transcriptional regulator